MKNFLVLLAFVYLQTEAKLPSNFQKCNRKDDNFKECVLKAAENGINQMSNAIKSVNLPSVDPLEIKELTIKAGTRAVAVDQYFTNCKLYGIDKLQFSRFEFDFEENNVQLAAVLPELRKECDYELDGKVLLLPMKGKGASTVVLYNVNVTALLPAEVTKENGKSHFKFHTIKIHASPSLVTFNFQNLFNGDKELGDNINKVLNDNWKDVFDDVVADYENALGLIAIQLFNRFFGKVAIEDAFD